ncbi:uncharacterized protein Z520_09148 [Fonsecaea multimorphosa CBS 102226]|uniref:Uncharacterized protein n=1 Tax=Fonsecaea multimorphosa CBS 102226 TaxID=1442371 RepID=A0A0D2IDL4_9EURO|nr:uncharacterized protein Z520_09148 [Fonsecaea multimorphosa CBS 102226]KIX95231.1 hypothetical protein Z520_09148 [Fonsecaea multimorphosa CBS 102226]OAL17276.1 hypothetical protein AYO22_11841 [Fonsecaea multimorphosa]
MAAASSTRPSTLADHPSLQPAFHLTIVIGPATAIGSLSRGTPLTVVPLVSGSFLSEPGFPIRVDARLKGQGVDYVHNDPDGGRMRLRSDLVVGSPFLFPSLQTIHIHYTGIVDITNEMRRILGLSANAKSTEFGNSLKCAQVPGLLARLVTAVVLAKEEEREQVRKPENYSARSSLMFFRGIKATRTMRRLLVRLDYASNGVVSSVAAAPPPPLVSIRPCISGAVGVEASFLRLLQLHAGTQLPLGLHQPCFLPLHFLPAHLPNLTPAKIKHKLSNVASTATTTLRNVMLEHRQLNGRARISHRSRHAKGQMSADFKGERMPNG